MLPLNVAWGSIEVLQRHCRQPAGQRPIIKYSPSYSPMSMCIWEYLYFVGCSVCKPYVTYGDIRAASHNIMMSLYRVGLRTFLC